MRIECPGCDAAYEVPEAQIRPGRSVRCVRCAVQWRPGGDLPGPIEIPLPAQPVHGPAAGDDALAVQDEPVRDAVVRLRQSGVPTPAAPMREPVGTAAAHAVRHLATWQMGWVASLVLLAGLLASAAYWRVAVMQDWPPSIRLYTMLGARPPQT